MQYAKSLSTPMASGLQLSRFGNALVANPKLYKLIIEARQYVTITKPKISYSVNKVCQFMSSPLKPYWKVAGMILRY